MDPISALILAGILSVLVGRTIASGVTDAIAQSRGETPPSLEKWRKRQEDRKARGEAPEKEPGAWGRRWRNSVEHRSAKAAQKHAARMELLRDNGPENVAKHKARLRKRAARWDKVNDTAARWGAASWDAAKTAAAKAKAAAEDALEERRAWQENERRDHELVDPAVGPADGAAADDTEADDPAVDTGSDNGQDAQVIPLRPDQDSTTRPTGVPQDAATAAPSTDTNTDDTTGGSMSAPANTTTEITDLDTAISYSAETAKYTDTVSGTLADVVGQLDTAAQGLAAEAAQYEQAKANLVDEGFGAKVTDKFDSAAEALNLAAEAIKTAKSRVEAGAEQVTTAGGEMRSASKVFSDQLAVSESVGAAQQDAGVSKRTNFYSPTGA